ncbi:MAG TPA: pantoate--beta-alanine ligase [Candidatus Kapabacteria bacterium]
MIVTTTVEELRHQITAAKRGGKSIGFVPTMGALHEGHLSLTKLSKKESDLTVVSIFVNPTQFGPNEDFSKYPRTIDQDSAMLESVGSDILFLPDKETMYPTGAATFVTVDGVTDNFEGAVRPGHFQGVSTVVASLFNIVTPDIAYFGQKDAQQVAVIKKMVKDLHFPLRIVIGETVREADGLAMSSRNRYLSTEEREKALTLSKTLYLVRKLISQSKPFEDVLLEGKQFFAKTGEITLEYLDLVDSETFARATSFKESESITALIAAKVGTTRLIDNVVITKS